MKDGTEKDIKTITEKDIKTIKEKLGDREEKLKLCAKIFLEALGENRRELIKTPQRYAKAILEILSGYNISPYDIVRDAIFEESYSGIIKVENIEFMSLCEHHLLPFFGTAEILYIPNGKIIGLSKIPRVVDAFSKRLQVQERLTREIADFLWEVLEPKGITVKISATHLCLAMRGAKKKNATLQTIESRGTILI